MSSKKEQRNSNANTVAVRFNDQLLKTLDDEVARRQKAAPWLEITRADVVREAVYKLISGASTTPGGQGTPLAEQTQSEATEKVCQICKRPLDGAKEVLCGREECKKEYKNAKERVRRKAQRRAQKESA